MAEAHARPHLRDGKASHACISLLLQSRGVQGLRSGEDAPSALSHAFLCKGDTHRLASPNLL